MKKWTPARLSWPAVLIVTLLVVIGCGTPINDTDLPVDTYVATPEPDATTPSTSEPDVTTTTPPDTSSDPTPDAILDDTAAPEDVAVPPTTEDASEATPDVAGTACESEAACVIYWQAYSDCLVQHGGQDAAVDPSFYSEDCAVTCDLAPLGDYPGYYACMRNGIPDDCASEAMTMPTDCSP